MTSKAIEQAVENIYASLQEDNQDIDLRIAELKTALAGEKKVTFEAARLAENSRQGRRYMQAYFKKHGLLVEFT